MFAGMEGVRMLKGCAPEPSLASVWLDSLSLVPLYSEADFRVLSTI